MAKQEIKMVALKTFDGLEGQFKKDDEFTVARKERAEALKKAGIADYAKDGKASSQEKGSK